MNLFYVLLFLMICAGLTSLASIGILVLLVAIHKDVWYIVYKLWRERG